MHFATDFWLTRLCFQRGLGWHLSDRVLIAAKSIHPAAGRARAATGAALFAPRPASPCAELVLDQLLDRFITRATVRHRVVDLRYRRLVGITWARPCRCSRGAALGDYLSLVNVGQTFYGFGWATMLAVDRFFLAIFLGHRTTHRQSSVMWQIVWVLFRTMFGAGLIKLRSDPCWRDLTCLFLHYETQPLPNR